MRFFNGLVRMFQGKPVFENPTQTPDPNQASVPGQPVAENTAPAEPATDRFGSPVDARGYKIIPEVELINLKTNRNGDQQVVTAWAVNKSDQEIRVDYTRILSQKLDINRQLGPGQSHEVVIYRGKTPMHDNDDDAEMVFRLMSNTDAFQRRYRVEFHRENDGGFLVEELHIDGPVKDI